MSKSYNELQVLKKLDIPDFRHMTKDKVMSFVSMLPNMDSEVAKKALEQFPNFATASLEIMREYRVVLDGMMQDDRESMQSCYDMYNRVMDSLEQLLQKDNLSFEEKTYIIERMKDIADAMSQKDSEKAANRLQILRMVGNVALGIITILGSVIGVNLLIGKNDG